MYMCVHLGHTQCIYFIYIYKIHIYTPTYEYMCVYVSVFYIYICMSVCECTWGSFWFSQYNVISLDHHIWGIFRYCEVSFTDSKSRFPEIPVGLYLPRLPRSFWCAPCCFLRVLLTALAHVCAALVQQVLTEAACSSAVGGCSDTTFKTLDIII